MAPNRLLEIPSGLRSLLYNSTMLFFPSRTSSQIHRLTPLLHIRPVSTDHLPRVAQPSLWQAMIPKPLRRTQDRRTTAHTHSTWHFIKSNPATPLLALALLIGSQAIHTIVLRRDTVAFSRQAEAKIALLREVVERLQRGEDVDVEAVLGTGVPEREEEWRSLVEEIERADVRWKKEKKLKESAVEDGFGEEVVKFEAVEAPKVAADEAHVEVERRKIGPIPKGFY